MPKLRNQQLIGDRYRLLQQLGRGGMADVWLAVDESDEDLLLSGDAPKVAMKFMNDLMLGAWMKASRTKGGHAKDPKESEYFKRFKREVKLQAQLRHENLVQVLDAGLWDGCPYYVSEYVNGKTLEDEILEHAKAVNLLDEDGELKLPEERAEVLRGPLYPLEDFFRVADQACKAFIYLHDHPTPGIKQIIHRDIKPANIMIVRSRRNVPTVKIMDFGIAKVFELDPKESQLTKEGTPGTPQYMAVEVFYTPGNPYKDKLGQVVPIGPPADIYSFGMVMFIMLTGVLPHVDKSHYLRIFEFLHDTAAPDPDPALYWPDMPRKLREVVMKCIAKQPWDRFQDADQLRSALIDAEAEIFGMRRGSSRPMADIAYSPTVHSEPPRALSASQIPTKKVEAVPSRNLPLKQHGSPWPLWAGAGMLVAALSGYGMFVATRPETIPRGEAPATVLAPPSPAAPDVPPEPASALPPSVPVPAGDAVRRAEAMNETARQAFDYGKTVAKRDCRAAIRSFELARTSSPNAPEIYAEMAKCYRQLRQFDQALEAESIARNLK